MPVIKRILCLANSRKLSGRCVAGREVLEAAPGPWIRPVSTREKEEVSEDERQYEDGSDPRVLDVIDIPLRHQRPHACQTENWVLDPDYYWLKVRRANWAEVQRNAETPATLWVNGRSTYYGSNDEIIRADADLLPNSLVLIRVPGLVLKVFAPGAEFGNPKRAVQAEFSYRGANYGIKVTDPSVEREYKAMNNGTYRIDECCICVSLSEPMQKNNGDWCRYKLAAAIIQRAKT